MQRTLRLLELSSVFI